MPYDIARTRASASEKLRRACCRNTHACEQFANLQMTPRNSTHACERWAIWLLTAHARVRAKQITQRKKLPRLARVRAKQLNSKKKLARLVRVRAKQLVHKKKKSSPSHACERARCTAKFARTRASESQLPKKCARTRASADTHRRCKYKLHSCVVKAVIAFFISPAISGVGAATTPRLNFFGVPRLMGCSNLYANRLPQSPRQERHG